MTMADGLPTENIFDKFDPVKTAAAPPAAAQPAAPAQPEPPPENANQPKANPFDEFGDVAPTETTATGALVRGAEKGALPAAAGLAAAGAGAELGGIVGTALGPFGAAGGALIGGVAGGIAGGAAVERAQHYLLSKLPDGFVDAFGLDEKKERLDQQQHPVASFVGGLVPYAVTMRPDKLAFAAKDLPENATALQTLMANPVTARLFGGGVMGGMEIANEKMDGQDLDWRKVGISTGFGLIWNKPTKFGEAITETGARPVRRMFGKSHPEAIPTVAQAGDAKVMGPGVTESVFQGTRDQAPDAAMTSQEMARSEAAALGDHPEPDVHSIARQMEPDLFARYEELQNRQRLFSAQTGPGGEEIPAVEHHLATTNAELDKLAPQVQAAYRRAAETVDTETVEPAPFKSFAEMLAAREGRTNVQEAEVPAVPSPVPGAEPGPVPGVSGLPGGGEAPPIVPGQEPAPGAVAPSPARTIGDQRAFIADDVAKRLIAAGRSEDEAKAAGQLIAARYITRAGRFEGKLGSPEELYSRESAAIAGPTGPAAAPGTPPARQVVEQTQAAGQASHEAAQAAQTAAKAAAAEHKPGIIARDFDTADRIKNEWRDQTPFKGSVDEFIAASKPNQEQLAAAGKEIAGELGLDFKDPGVKADGPGKGRDRLQTKASRIGAVGAVTDQVRAGFNAETPAQADRIVERLGQKFQITDEGWQTSPAVYFDRKVYVRFPDGMIGEVQIWPPGMFAAKEHAGGHALYEGVRELPQWHPLIPEFNRAQGELYAPVRAALSDDWKAALGSSGNEPNLLPKAAGESTAELRPTSAALTSSQEPLISAQASEGVQKAGKPSQETDLTSDMFGVPAENVGPHAAPVNAAIYASDKINDLSPAEQKREIPKFTPEAERTPKGVDQPAGVFMFNPTQLSVDAQRFQFKSGGDEYGVTGARRNVTKWDPAKAQAIIVWEANDGKLFVADGHQRAGLARRLTEQGKAKDIQLPGILYREKDGISADDIRAMAAVTNIANGSGSALDGAKVLRARPDLMDGSLPLSVGKGKQAAALARLSDEPFRMIVNDVVPEHYGAVVGELIPNDPDRQTAALKAIARFEPKNADEAAVLTQRVAQAELAKREEGAQASMFGDLETPESTAGEEMKIVGRAIADLKKDKSLFARVLRNAERIEETGSQIQREAAQSITSDAEIFAKTLTSDAYTAGPIRNELIAAAKDLKNGKATVGEASERIVSALRAQAEAHGADRTGAVERGAEAKEYAQRDLLESQYEPGAEGKPQALIPGVAPVTQRDLIQRAANAPLKPKVAQKEAGGLFGESMNQKELFQRISQVTLDK